MFTLEFAALLPMFIVFSLLIVESQELMLRAICNSHAAFADARRRLVAENGMADDGYVKNHYEKTGMRGSYTPTPEPSGSRPRSMKVTIVDHYNILMPTGSSDGAFLGLKKETFSKLSVHESVGGGGVKLPQNSTDNDIN